ncbi:hypothetical protein AAFF_G00047050 [Aldrovandia affinis]|uniref:Uncharacterized protein n=1 Tax=Aldrovandia affinis TaxID=143900 RepID=A0AAD7S1N8_9TELE|nr:hypothetical protein AAFF_G00047050 [Aldrovandia affinis]
MMAQLTGEQRGTSYRRRLMCRWDVSDTAPRWRYVSIVSGDGADKDGGGRSGVANDVFWGILRRHGPPFLGPHTPWGTERSQNSRVVSHRQTPQSTSPVEVTHRCRRTTSTHPAPPDSNGHPRGRHHLAGAQNRTPKIFSPPSHTENPPESPMSSVPLELRHVKPASDGCNILKASTGEKSFTTSASALAE